MKILILGGTGLIGHKLWIELSKRFQDTYTIIHSKKENYDEYGWYSGNNVIDNIDIMEYDKFQEVISSIQPDVILNCIGITKRKLEINDPILALSINSLLPLKFSVVIN